MALRARKPAKPLVESIEEDEAKKPAAKANRRKTVAGAAILAAEKVLLHSSITKLSKSRMLTANTGCYQKHNTTAGAYPAQLLEAN
jgi:hypothetical protein